MEQQVENMKKLSIKDKSKTKKTVEIVESKQTDKETVGDEIVGNETVELPEIQKKEVIKLTKEQVSEIADKMLAKMRSNKSKKTKEK